MGAGTSSSARRHTASVRAAVAEVAHRKKSGRTPSAVGEGCVFQADSADLPTSDERISIL